MNDLFPSGGVSAFSKVQYALGDVSRRHIYNLIQANKLPAPVRHGRRALFINDELRPSVALLIDEMKASRDAA